MGVAISDGRKSSLNGYLFSLLLRQTDSGLRQNGIGPAANAA
jgi:hypothetical protein